MSSVDTSDYYTRIDLPVDIADDILEYINTNKSEFFTSELGFPRIEFDVSLILKLFKFIPFSVGDSGVLQNSPGWFYSMHKDAHRQCALNMLIVDDDEDFEALIYDDEHNVIGKIPYIKNQWLLLNTKKFHSVKNNSTTRTRYVVSIGCHTHDYHTIRDNLLSDSEIND